MYFHTTPQFTTKQGLPALVSLGICGVICFHTTPQFVTKSFPFLAFVLSSQVADLQKKIAAAVARLKQQQNLYEAVRSDRNVYSKNLIETQVRLATLFLLPFNVQLPR